MDIQNLIPQAVQSMQTSGQVRPTVYAQLDSASVHRFVLFNFIGDGRTKAHVLFAEGPRPGRSTENASCVRRAWSQKSGCKL